MVGFLSCPWCCCNASQEVAEVAGVGKPSCCAKQVSEPVPCSDKDELPVHECCCAKQKEVVAPVELLLPENSSAGMRVDFPLGLESPARDWIDSGDQLVRDLDLPPPPPIRQVFCVLRL